LHIPLLQRNNEPWLSGVLTYPPSDLETSIQSEPDSWWRAFMLTSVLFPAILFKKESRDPLEKPVVSQGYLIDEKELS
jgi:hypothetical protein